MRNLSSAALESLFSESTDEVWLVLITFDHPDLAQPLRFVNNTESVTSNGNLFIAFPFEIELPLSDKEDVGEVRLRIDNIDRQIVTTLRELESPPTATIQVILASQPDTIEIEFEGLTLRNAEFTALEVQASLRFEDITVEPVSLEMTPGRFPAMFALTTLAVGLSAQLMNLSQVVL